MRSAALAGAFLRRDFAVARTYRASFVLQGFASAFVLVLLFQVGRLVDRAPTAATADLSHGYFSFAVVGTAILGLVQTALHSFAVKLGQEQATGTMEALLATPASPSAVILGSALYELAQALLLAVVVLTVGSFVGVHVVLAPVSLLGSVVALLGLLTLFAGLGVAVAAFTMAFKRGTALAGLITGALALLGCVVPRHPAARRGALGRAAPTLHLGGGGPAGLSALRARGCAAVGGAVGQRRRGAGRGPVVVRRVRGLRQASGKFGAILSASIVQAGGEHRQVHPNLFFGYHCSMTTMPTKSTAMQTEGTGRAGVRSATADDPLAASRVRVLVDAFGGAQLAKLIGVSASQPTRWAKGQERPGIAAAAPID